MSPCHASCVMMPVHEETVADGPTLHKNHRRLAPLGLPLAEACGRSPGNRAPSARTGYSDMHCEGERARAASITPSISLLSRYTTHGFDTHDAWASRALTRLR